LREGRVRLKNGQTRLLGRWRPGGTAAVAGWPGGPNVNVSARSMLFNLVHVGGDAGEARDAELAEDGGQLFTAGASGLRGSLLTCTLGGDHGRRHQRRRRPLGHRGRHGLRPNQRHPPGRRRSRRGRTRKSPFLEHAHPSSPDIQKLRLETAINVKASTVDVIDNPVDGIGNNNHQDREVDL